MPSDGDAAAVVDRFSKVTQKHDFSDKISIEATYYAYYFSWLYSNFSESKTKQALECPSEEKKLHVYFFLNQTENNLTKTSFCNYENNRVDFNILLHTCSFEVLNAIKVR